MKHHQLPYKVFLRIMFSHIVCIAKYTSVEVKYASAPDMSMAHLCISAQPSPDAKQAKPWGILIAKEDTVCEQVHIWEIRTLLRAPVIYLQGFCQGICITDLLIRLSEKEFKVKIGTCFRRCSDCSSLISRYREFIDWNIIELHGSCTFSQNRGSNFYYEDHFDWLTITPGIRECSVRE